MVDNYVARGEMSHGGGRVLLMLDEDEGGSRRRIGCLVEAVAEIRQPLPQVVRQEPVTAMNRRDSVLQDDGQSPGSRVRDARGGGPELEAPGVRPGGRIANVEKKLVFNTEP